MGFLIENINVSVRVSLTALKCVGFWLPDSLNGTKRLVYYCYGFLSFMFVLGTYIICQVVDLFQIWGDLPMMTSTAFLLFTNLAHFSKIVNIVVRRHQIQDIIDDAHKDLTSENSEEGKEIVDSCNFETKWQQRLYFFLTGITLIGWSTSPEKGQLPLRAWYPYDASVSPAYKITYGHQVFAVLISGYLNVAKDTLVTTLIAQCRCRLRLLGLSLRTLSHDIVIPENKFQRLLTLEQEKVVKTRLRCCVQRHQAALEAAAQLQHCFSEPTFVQFVVSLIIICVTAFQMVSQTGNMVRLLSMGTYLMNMMYQVFIYCYQGNQLAVESTELASAAYEVPWYACRLGVRRSLAVVSTLCQRVARLTAGGFTTLSLASFMAIIKASYSLFTLLQQVVERIFPNINMGIFVDNLNLPLRVTQTVFILFGIWAPSSLKGSMKILFSFYTFVSFMLYTGTYIIIQVGDLCQVWGNVPLMTGTIFLLLTNLSLSTKALNVYWRQEAIQAMIDEARSELSEESRPEGKEIVQSFNQDTKIQLYIYFCLTYTTVAGWTFSAEKNQLPLRAWYPYDTTKTPAYQLTYAHQCIALSVAACINVCLDTLVTTLISQCCCRLNLLSLTLRMLCDGLQVTKQGILSPTGEEVVAQRIRSSVQQHQAILKQVAQLQKFFSIPVLVQFSVSMVIICVTAYQMAIVSIKSLVWLIGMVAYLAVMLLQVFIYCYRGNELVIESGKVAEAAYECPWYICSPRLRRCLLLVMRRSQRELKLKAGGLTELSLATFMGIVKASYTFFTVLQQVDDE
ncbi:uncharacterized protein [Epargyreus clarus]|uniref:uncharacterized protein n=1 Tax=Epargyreus clarus TaxID=520877 RepID=UPI003C2FF35A